MPFRARARVQTIHPSSRHFRDQRGSLGGGWDAHLRQHRGVCQGGCSSPCKSAGRASQRLDRCALRQASTRDLFIPWKGYEIVRDRVQDRLYGSSRIGRIGLGGREKSATPNAPAPGIFPSSLGGSSSSRMASRRVCWFHSTWWPTFPMCPIGTRHQWPRPATGSRPRTSACPQRSRQTNPARYQANR